MLRILAPITGSSEAFAACWTVSPMISAHFLSFANRRYAGSLVRIRREAEAVGRFRSIQTIDERGLGSDYWRMHADTVRRHRRGFGLWTWKPYVVRRSLEDLPEGDLLLYCDVGCSLNAEGLGRLEEYLALAADDPTGVLAFALDGTVGEFTKRAALAACGVDGPGMRRREMISATCVVMLAGPAALDLVREWEERMADLTIVDDSPSAGGEHPEFLAHRHDQSIFTLLAHGRGLRPIPDETYWENVWDESRRFPIHARRWRHRLPWSQAWMRRGLWPRW